MIFFEPTKNFWSYFTKHPWKWKQYHECGAGSGHLTKLMWEHGLSCRAYDMYPRGKDNEVGSQLNVMDTTTEQFGDLLCTNDAVIIARPCHSGWVARTMRHTFDIGHALYVGLPKNFETDLDADDLCYEVVADDVGQDGEKLLKVYCDNAHAKILRLIKTSLGHEEWWWYRKSIDRYVTEPWGISGFDNGGEEVLKELKRGNNLQMGFAKDVLCDDKLDSGWIAPDGEFFGCKECNHDNVMETVVGISVGRAEELGFVRCHGFTCAGTMLYVVGRGYQDDFRHRPNPAQAKTLRRKGYKVIR